MHKPRKSGRQRGEIPCQEKVLDPVVLETGRGQDSLHAGIKIIARAMVNGARGIGRSNCLAHVFQQLLKGLRQNIIRPDCRAKRRRDDGCPMLEMIVVIEVVDPYLHFLFCRRWRPVPYL